jgi:hypothetical protein
MHDEQDFLAAHGCTTPEEYDRKRFFEWVDAMEDTYARQDPMAPFFKPQGIAVKNDRHAVFKALPRSVVNNSHLGANSA